MREPRELAVFSRGTLETAYTPHVLGRGTPQTGTTPQSGGELNGQRERWTWEGRVGGGPGADVLGNSDTEGEYQARKDTEKPAPL